MQSRQHAEAFRILAERDKSALWHPLLAAIDRVFVAVQRFYSANKGKGDTAIDISTFFRHTKGRHGQFERTWNDAGNKGRTIFLRKTEEVQEAMSSFER